jgi:hypothetical protein
MLTEQVILSFTRDRASENYLLLISSRKYKASSICNILANHFLGGSASEIVNVSLNCAAVVASVC